MSNYQYAVRCRNCNKVYGEGTPEVCYKCGTIIKTKEEKMEYELTENAEFVIARRKFLGWEILKPEE